MFSGNDVVLPNDIVIPTDIVMPSILCRISTGDTRLWKNAGTVCSGDPKHITLTYRK